MASKLHSNAIITGCLDAYCLVCNSHLKCEEDAYDHIEKPEHNENLNSTHNSVNFKGDHIRVLKKGYFCAFCNLILSTKSKVGLHVKNEEHNNIKGIRLLKRIGNAVLASDDVFIIEKVWNGFIEDTCAICNVEFSDERIHKFDQKHILNLVQKKVEFGAEGSIYRKVDDTSFQCLTCNMIFALDTIKIHFKDETHKKLFAKCREFNKPDPISPKGQINKQLRVKVINQLQGNSKIEKDDKVKGLLKTGQGTPKDKPIEIKYEVKEHSGENNGNGQNVPTEHSNHAGENLTSIKSESDSSTHRANSSEGGNKQDKPKSNKVETNQGARCPDDTQTKESKNQKNRAKILDNALEFQKNGVNINFVTEIAYCKKCVQHVDLDFNVIENHILEHKKNTKVEDPVENMALKSSVDQNQNNSVLLNEEDCVVCKMMGQNNDNKTNDYSHNQNSKDEAGGFETKVSINASNETPNDDNLNKALVKFMPLIPEENLNVNIEPKAEDNDNIPSIESDDPFKFAKANKLTFNKGNSNAFCRLCNTRLPSSLRSMKEHVAGVSHKKKAANVAKIKPVIPKKPMKSFIKNRVTVQTRIVDDVIINDKYYISQLSYFMITKHGNRFRCQSCEENLNEDDIGFHTLTSRHERAMDETPVLWNFTSEFIREVRPELFHCAFCNLIVGCWEDVDKHLKCEDHKESKISASRYLEDYMPGVLLNRRRRDIALMRMFMLGHLS